MSTVELREAIVEWVERHHGLKAEDGAESVQAKYEPGGARINSILVKVKSGTPYRGEG